MRRAAYALSQVKEEKKTLAIVGENVRSSTSEAVLAPVIFTPPVWHKNSGSTDDSIGCVFLFFNSLKSMPII